MATHMHAIYLLYLIILFVFVNKIVHSLLHARSCDDTDECALYGKSYYPVVYRVRKCVMQYGPIIDIFQLIISSVAIRPTAYKKKTTAIHNFVALGMFATDL